MGALLFVLALSMYDGNTNPCGQPTLAGIIAVCTCVYLITQLVQLCYMCKYSSKMRAVDYKASKGEINADQLADGRIFATSTFGATFMKFAVFKGMIFVVWIVLHYIVN